MENEKTENWSWSDWSKKDPAGLARMQNLMPQTFQRLYDAEFNPGKPQPKAKQEDPTPISETPEDNRAAIAEMVNSVNQRLQAAKESGTWREPEPESGFEDLTD